MPCAGAYTDEDNMYSQKTAKHRLRIMMALGSRSAGWGKILSGCSWACRWYTEYCVHVLQSSSVKALCHNTPTCRWGPMFSELYKLGFGCLFSHMCSHVCNVSVSRLPHTSSESSTHPSLALLTCPWRLCGERDTKLWLGDTPGHHNSCGHKKQSVVFLG